MAEQNNNQLDFLTTLKAIMAAASCCSEIKKAGQNYMAANGSDAQKEALSQLLDIVKNNISTIDETIQFFGSSAAKQEFGESEAKKMEEHALDVKAHGGKYCDCEACRQARALLELHAETL